MLSSAVDQLVDIVLTSLRQLTAAVDQGAVVTGVPIGVRVPRAEPRNFTNVRLRFQPARCLLHKGHDLRLTATAGTGDTLSSPNEFS